MKRLLCYLRQNVIACLALFIALGGVSYAAALPRNSVGNQQIKKDGADRGSWEPEGGWFGTSCGRLGTTAMCLLTLEVYYRHLPLFKRDGGGENLK